MVVVKRLLGVLGFVADTFKAMGNCPKVGRLAVSSALT
jgi:hypothetical protein